MTKTDFAPPPAFPRLEIEMLRWEGGLAGAWRPGAVVLDGAFWRLYWCPRPGAEVRVGREWRELAPGALHLVPPNAALPARCLTPDTGQLYVHFTLPGIAPGRPGRLYSLPATPPEASAAEELRRLTVDGAPRADAGLAALALCAAALRRLPADALRPAPGDPRIWNACAAMRADPAAPHAVADLAAAAHLTPEPFTRLFRRVTGTTPHRYLREIRYAEAARLLTGTDLSIEAIGARVGIFDRFQFSRGFREFYGRPPAAYRHGDAADE